MTSALLTRQFHRTPERPVLPVAGFCTLALGRVHELCGAARRTLALAVAAQTRGPVLWIAPAWQTERLNPDGMLALVDPGRFLFISPRRPDDLLWSMEEALRSGAAPLVVADLPEAPALTPVRRLHLAAEAAGATGPAPLGLLLTPGPGGAQGIESRWSLAPAPSDGPPAWHLARRRARAEPPADWRLTRSKGEWQSSPLSA